MLYAHFPLALATLVEQHPANQDQSHPGNFKLLVPLRKKKTRNKVTYLSAVPDDYRLHLIGHFGFSFAHWDKQLDIDWVHTLSHINVS